jgi:8-oxo-dGTP pyrophosphatase MutT (NUDIX family)
MEPGETPLETGIREVCEEMGVTGPMEAIRQLSTIRYGFTIPGGAPRLKTVYMFLLRTSVRWDVFDLADSEGVVGADWFTPEAAANLVRHRSLVPIVVALRDDLAVNAPLIRDGERPRGTDEPSRAESESRD